MDIGEKCYPFFLESPTLPSSGGTKGRELNQKWAVRSLKESILCFQRLKKLLIDFSNQFAEFSKQEDCWAPFCIFLTSE